jgi:polysaccharide export outer membrane protein
MRPVTYIVGALLAVCICTQANAGPAKAIGLSAGVNREHAAHASASIIASQTLNAHGERYRLFPSDEIMITFALTPEFDRDVTIEPDGYASLSGAGDVRLAGLTTEEAVAAIKVAYAKVLHDPIVTVELKNFNKPFFVVTGQVNHPGKYDLRGATSATQAVAIAGGMTSAAKASHALLFRRVDGGRYEVMRVNFKRIFGGHESEDAALQPGDMIFVPKSVSSKIERLIPSSGFGAYYQP